jgi:RNA polymerase sigma-70 factor (ECF subfamily)
MIISKDICERLSDREMIQKIHENLDYFNCLYDRYGAIMLRYIRRISSISTHEAEDVLQDAFIKVWKNINAFDSSLKLSSWLYRIVHNETISHWRKDKWNQNNAFLELDEKKLENIADDLGVDEECCPELITIVDQVSPKYREVVVLKYFEDLSYEDISDILKIPEGTVAIRLNRAKKALLKLLKNHKSLPYG